MNRQKESAMKAKTMGWLVVMLLALAACEGDRAVPAGQGDRHASAEVVPGSYDDWCGEHEVPESQCTRCDRALIAAFKATGDWCEEHGLPESHCKACDPGLRIVRPPRKTGAR
jgi:hypothetical protein